MRGDDEVVQEVPNEYGDNWGVGGMVIDGSGDERERESIIKNLIVMIWFWYVEIQKI